MCIQAPPSSLFYYHEQHLIFSRYLKLFIYYCFFHVQGWKISPPNLLNLNFYEGRCLQPPPRDHFDFNVTKLFGNVFKNSSHFILFKWNWNWRGSLFKYSPEGTGHGQKYIKSKNYKKFVLNFEVPWGVTDCRFARYLDILVSQTTFE